MNRKQYMNSLGATCANHNFSWSFVNHTEKIVYFGWWEHDNCEDGGERIFSLDWERDKKGHRAKGFKESCDNIDLVEIHGFKLKTFTMEAKDPSAEPIKIKRIVESVRDGVLSVNGNDYFAYPKPISENPAKPFVSKYMEGAVKIVSQTLRERNPEARRKCLEEYGFACRVCDFDFNRTYGAMGMGYIHVHHLEMVAGRNGEYEINPTIDLRPVCPNCHAMIHARKKPFSISEMRHTLGLVELVNP